LRAVPAMTNVRQTASTQLQVKLTHCLHSLKVNNFEAEKYSS
jgi:hypothetical protein